MRYILQIPKLKRWHESQAYFEADMQQLEMAAQVTKSAIHI